MFLSGKVHKAKVIPCDVEFGFFLNEMLKKCLTRSPDPRLGTRKHAKDQNDSCENDCESPPQIFSLEKRLDRRPQKQNNADRWEIHVAICAKHHRICLHIGKKTGAESEQEKRSAKECSVIFQEESEDEGKNRRNQNNG